MDAVVSKRDLGKEDIGQHPFIVAHRLIVDTHIPQVRARQFRDVTIVLGIKPGAEDIDDPDRSRLLGARLEQLLLASSYSPILELLFDDLQPFSDLAFVDAGTVSSKQELDDIGRNRILPRVFSDEVLADEVSVEYRRSQLIELI